MLARTAACLPEEYVLIIVVVRRVADVVRRDRKTAALKRTVNANVLGDLVSKYGVVEELGKRAVGCIVRANERVEMEGGFAKKRHVHRD